MEDGITKEYGPWWRLALYRRTWPITRTEGMLRTVLDAVRKHRQRREGFQIVARASAVVEGVRRILDDVASKDDAPRREKEAVQRAARRKIFQHVLTGGGWKLKRRTVDQLLRAAVPQHTSTEKPGRKRRVEEFLADDIGEGKSGQEKLGKLRRAILGTEQPMSAVKKPQHARLLAEPDIFDPELALRFFVTQFSFGFTAEEVAEVIKGWRRAHQMALHRHVTAIGETLAADSRSLQERLSTAFDVPEADDDAPIGQRLSPFISVIPARYLDEE